MGQNLCQLYPASYRALQNKREPDLIVLLREQIEAIDAGRLLVRVPEATGLMRRYGDTHFHVKAEYNFLLSGVCKLQTFDKTLRIPAGYAVILPRGLPHRAMYAPCSGTPFFMLAVEHHRPLGVINFIYLRARQMDLYASTIYRQPVSKGFCVADYLEEIAALHYRRQYLRKKAIKGLMLAYLAGLLAELKNVSPVRRTDQNWQIVRCQNMITAHLSETRLSVKMLAKALKLSPDYLSHLFVTHTGTTLTKYINQVRVEYARALLADSSLSVKEIAWAAGYNDPGYFIRVFRRLTGTTPLLLRQKNLMPQHSAALGVTA